MSTLILPSLQAGSEPAAGLLRHAAGNVLVDPNGRGARVGSPHSAWTINAFGTDTTGAIVGVRQVGSVRVFSIRINGTTNASSDSGRIQFAEQTAGFYPAATSDVFDIGVYARRVAGDFTNVTSITLNQDHFNVTPSYAGGSYPGVDWKAFMDRRAPLDQSLLLHRVTVGTASTVWGNLYFSIAHATSQPVDYTLEVSQPFAVKV